MLRILKLSRTNRERTQVLIAVFPQIKQPRINNSIIKKLLYFNQNIPVKYPPQKLHAVMKILVIVITLNSDSVIYFSKISLKSIFLVFSFFYFLQLRTILIFLFLQIFSIRLQGCKYFLLGFLPERK